MNLRLCMDSQPNLSAGEIERGKVRNQVVGVDRRREAHKDGEFRLH